MDKFDLKVALSLLPVMNDELSNLRQLIDGIEYYSSVLNAESQTYLISFVVKSRLSQSAKLKLATKYDTVPNLLNDMKMLLLPKKSTSALQKQFLNCKQNDMSIDVFGKTLSELFVDLTISQSEGSVEKFNILKSINEKQAIRQFSDGLRNRRIGTIITAQRFENLKDAIQAAIDEDVSGSGAAAEVLTLRHNNNRFLKNNSRPPPLQNIPSGRWRGNPHNNWRQPHTRTRQWAQQPQPQPRGAPRGRAQYRGATALWCAAGAGHLGIVKRLVRAGANVNHATRTLSTPLRAACFDGRLDIVKYLVRHGADVHKANKYNNTCLMIASYKGHLDVVQFLLDSGARVDDRALCGATALHFAAECGHAAVVCALIDHDAKIVKNENGLTPLQCAAERARASVVEILATRPEVSREQHIEAYELLGASFANDKEYYCVRLAYQYLHRAMTMRYDKRFDLMVKKTLPPVPAYDNWKESTTLEEVERLHGNSHAIHMEGLTVRERILGRACPDLPHPVVFRGAVFADEARFDRCLALWRHALTLRLENQVSVVKDLLRFAQVFSQMIHIGIELPLEQVSFVLEACAEELSRGQKRLLKAGSANIDPETIQEEYECNVRTALYLSTVAAKLMELDGADCESANSVRMAIFKLRNTKNRNGGTLLHMAVDRRTPVDDFHTSDVCQFPCPRTTKLLLECGLAVDATDDIMRTPLLSCLLSYQLCDTGDLDESEKYSELLCGVVCELLSKGAHVDSVDYDGITPLVAAMSGPAETIVRAGMRPRLTCLAATTLARARLKYNPSQVPKVLHGFLVMHGVDPASE